MNEIAKKIQVLKLSLSVIDSVDSLLMLANKNLSDLRALYKSNKPSFSNEDIVFLQSIAKLIDSLNILKSYIATRKRLEFSERAQSLLQNLQNIQNEFAGYEVENIVQREILKTATMVSKLPKLYSKPHKKHTSHLMPNPPSILPIKKAKQVENLGEMSSKVCIDCGGKIIKARVDANPQVLRCIGCQIAFEQTHDTRIKVDEGFGGSREEVKRMKAKQWGEVVNRDFTNVGRRKK